MNDIAKIGDNNPPIPIDGIDPSDIIAPFMDDIEEARSWLDGKPVTNEGQSSDVDRLQAALKGAMSAVNKSRDPEVRALKRPHTACCNKWNVYTDDLALVVKGLAAAQNPYKQKLAAEKREAERKAYEEADKKRREAEEKAAKASACDIEAQREAAQAAQVAQDAKQAAAAASKDNVKGMRRTQMHEVIDRAAVLNDIIKMDSDAVDAFVDEYARLNFKKRVIAGVRTWTESFAV